MILINDKKLFRASERAGFTLIELLLYVAVAVAVLLSIVAFISLLLESRAHSQAIMEVESQGRSAMEFIASRARNAAAITTPVVGNSAQLSLVMADPLKNPTSVDAPNGVLRAREGAGLPVALTNNRVTASNLIFQNVSRPGTRGIIRVQVTLTYKDTTGRREYMYQQTFITSAALR